MDILRGKLYVNRTWLYLFPCVKSHGADLEAYITKFYKLGVGIGDFSTQITEPAFFILFDPYVNCIGMSKEDTLEEFQKFLDWVRLQNCYVDDYLYDITEESPHMVVIKIPSKCLPTYDLFLLGEYSKMYGKIELDRYFPVVSQDNPLYAARNEKNISLRNIFFKTEIRRKEFMGIVNKLFETDVEEHFFLEAELDFQPKLNEEIFNYEVL